jgi:hypothetical protein
MLGEAAWPLAVRMRDYRRCAEPGCDRMFMPKSSRNRYCLQHRKTKPVDPSHYRKYGPTHRRLRAQWATRVASGTVECARCGELIAQSAAWDLGHVDGALAYSGPEHAECNRATATHRVGRDGRRGSSRSSRIW